MKTEDSIALLRRITSDRTTPEQVLLTGLEIRVRQIGVSKSPTV
jgi:hypothetical protein